MTRKSDTPVPEPSPQERANISDSRHRSPSTTRAVKRFLFAYLQNISEMGIFIRTDHPSRVGTRLRLRFQVEHGEPLTLEGEVTWINPLRASGDNLNPAWVCVSSSCRPTNVKKSWASSAPSRICMTTIATTTRKPEPAPRAWFRVLTKRTN